VAEVEKILTEKEIYVLILNLKLLNNALDFIKSLNLKYPKTIKILTSQEVEKETLIQLINIDGIFKFIPKPWDNEKIIELLEKGISRYKQQKDSQERLEELQYRCKEMNFLHEISQKISEKKPLSKLLNEIMVSSKTVMNAEASSLLLYNPEDKKLHFQVATGEKGKTVSKYSVDLGVGIAGWVAKHREPLLIEDCYRDPRFSPEYDKKTKFKTKSMVCVPLIRKKQLLGVIQVLNKKNGGVFEDSDLTTFETLASQCAISIENAKLIEAQVEAEALERELETAREIQQKLLPSTLPQFDDIQIAANLIPAKMVGGDYYNILKIDEEKTLFFISDVSGKGIPSALIVSTIYSCLETYLNMNKKNLKLLDLVSAMNKVLLDATTIDKYATCWFGLFDHSKKILTSVNAGHNAPLVFGKRFEQPQPLKEGGVFLGCLEVPFTREKFQLHSEDVLVFFTDGVTEAWNEKNEDYEEKRLIEIVNKNTSCTAEDILAEIEQDVKRHVGKAEQSDDFTCAVVKVN
jgi:sigma-B regulation protein RsbU (phosphoserine phosphatase)